MALANTTDSREFEPRTPSLALRWRFLIAVAVLSLIFPTGRLDAADLSRAQFLADYRAAVAQLQQAVSRVQCDLSQEKKTPKKSDDSPAGTRQINYLYAANEGREKLEYFIEHDSNGPPNPDNREEAGLSRHVILSADGKLHILLGGYDGGAFYLSSEGSKSPSQVKYLETLKGESVSLLFSPAVFDMLQHIDDPGFLEKVEQVEQAGESLIRAQVKWTFAKPNEPSAVTRVSGWILVDPARTYTMREYELHGDVSKTGATVLATGKIDYTDAKGLPIPTRFSAISTIDMPPKTKGAKVGRVLDVDRWEYTAPPAEAFTLAAYGLGDVETPRARGGGYVAYMAFGIAAAALAASLWLRRLAGGFRRADSA